jgi:hypothetical protein
MTEQIALVRNWTLASSLCLLICLTAPSSHADPAKARLGRLAWSAFECAAYAKISGQSNEQARLFGLGLESARALVVAYSNKQITNEEASTEIPMGVLDVLTGPAGPSTDFTAGRIFESAMQNAIEQVMKWDKDGPMPPAKWITSPSLAQSIAQEKFSQRNCLLVR